MTLPVSHPHVVASMLSARLAERGAPVQATVWNPGAGLHVLMELDDNDAREVRILRGLPADVDVGWLLHDQFSRLAQMGAHVLIGWSLRTGHPFAVGSLAPLDGASVGQAALLARDHGAHRRELVHLVRALRGFLPEWCAHVGFNRVEARSWAAHPTAFRLLAGVGFEIEAQLAGFGPSGLSRVNQFAWTARQKESRACA